MKLLYITLLLTTTIEPATFSDPSSSSSSATSLSPFPTPQPQTTTTVDREEGGGGGEGGVEEETLTLVPSGSLILAEGDTAVLECHLQTAEPTSSLSSSSSSSSAAAATTTLSWINATTNFTMTTDDVKIYGNIELTRKTGKDDGVSVLNMTILNVMTGNTTFVCQSNCSEHDAPAMMKQMSINLNVTSSDTLCTFENEASSDWTTDDDKIWFRMTSSSQIDGSTCTSGFSDHTYGGSDHLGHYMVARVTPGQSSSQNKTGNLTSKTFSTHLQRKCLHIFYRTCGTNNSGNLMTVLMIENDDGKSSSSSSSLVTSTKLTEIPVITRNGELTSSWMETHFTIPTQDQNSYEVILSVTFTDTSDVSYFAVDDIRIDDGDCPSDDEETIASKIPPSAEETTTTTSLSSSLSSIKAASGDCDNSSSVPSSSTTSGVSRSIQFSTSISNIPIFPTKFISTTTTTTQKTTTTFLTSSSTSKQSETNCTDTSAEVDVESQHQTADDDDDDDDDDDSGSSDNSTGLAIGIILAIMVAGACTAAILYRRKRNGKKSTYITFGNPSYSREHLPVNDFGLDSPLTLSSNGYTVLA